MPCNMTCNMNSKAQLESFRNRAKQCTLASGAGELNNLERSTCPLIRLTPATYTDELSGSVFSLPRYRFLSRLKPQKFNQVLRPQHCRQCRHIPCSSDLALPGRLPPHPVRKKSRIRGGGAEPPAEPNFGSAFLLVFPNNCMGCRR